MAKKILSHYSLGSSLEKRGIAYKGNRFWLLLFLILFFPIGILLLIRNIIRKKDDKIYYLEYKKSWKWLFFWAIVFFPISFILLIFNGLSFVEDDNFSQLN